MAKFSQVLCAVCIPLNMLTVFNGIRTGNTALTLLGIVCLVLVIPGAFRR